MKRQNTIFLFLFFCILLGLCLAGCANSSTAAVTPYNPTRDPQHEKTLEKQLLGMNPTALPVYRDAISALDAGDYQTARLLYQKVIELAPDFSTAYRRLGGIESESNLEEGINLARKAMEIERNADNQANLAYLLLSKNIPSDNQDAYELASLAVKTQPNNFYAVLPWAEAAWRTDHIDDFRDATDRLLRIAPTFPFTHMYIGLLYVNDGKWESAEKELRYAEKLGAPAEAIQPILDSGISRNASIIRAIRWGAIAFVLWFIGFGVLYLVGTNLSKAMMQAITKASSIPKVEVSPEEKQIRSRYRKVITILSFYYYISIPFVILSLFLVVAVILYFFLSIGFLTYSIVGILIIMLLGTLFAVFRALFSRSKKSKPGRELLRKDEPDLWLIAEEAARKIETRPVDSILITPGIDIAVYEEGSIYKKLRGKGYRNLILGMGVLQGLSKDQFAAILAHEYGHFSNRDTAGGDLAKNVTLSLDKMAESLSRTGAGQIINPAMWFIIGYSRIFFRITRGASRLQEILADRYAAKAYGGKNFIDGLKNLIRQSVYFPVQAGNGLKNLVEKNQTVTNLYDLPVPENLSEDLEKQYEETMNRTTSEYDSHPAPQERIDYIEKLQYPSTAELEHSEPARELFSDFEKLQREMTAEIVNSINQK
jgi:Zn-dependent protease with chaperone function